MLKREYRSKFFRITYTLEEEGPHPTIPYDYYDDTYAITAVLQGEGTCYIEGHANHLSPGAIVVMSPEEIRSFRLAQTGCHERISLYFSGAILSPMWDYELPLMQVFRRENRYTPEQYDTPTVIPILEKLRSIVSGEGETLQDSRSHLLILQLLMALYDAGEDQPRAVAGVVQDKKIAEICKFVKENLSQDLSYEVLQSRFLVSRYQLTEVFRRSTGMTLTEYIIHKRLRHAIARMQAGESMETAAYQAGFRTYSHFYKEFKKRYKLSPRQYCASREF